MAVFNNILAGASGQTGGAAAGYEITRSLRFNSADTAYLSRTPSSAGNRLVYTLSYWVKRTKLGEETIWQAGTGSNYTQQYFTSGDQMRFQNVSGGSSVTNFLTNAVFRDVGAWYHIVISSNSSTSLKVYVNGVEQTFSSSVGPVATDHQVNNTVLHQIGNGGAGAANSYIADFQLIDGLALPATAFGEYDANNVWQPKQIDSAPNNGTTWSDYVSTADGESTGNTFDHLFDGSTSTVAANPDNTGADEASAVTFQPPGGIAYTSKIEVYHRGASGDASGKASVNDGTTVNCPLGQWNTVATGEGTLNKLEMWIDPGTTSIGENAAAGIKVDGVILIDGWNQFGTDGIKVSTFVNPANAFDSDANTYATVNGNGNLGSFTNLSIPVTSTLSIRIVSGTNGTIYVNGVGTAFTGSGSVQSVSISNPPAVVTSLGFQSGSQPDVYNIIADGSTVTGTIAQGQNSFHLDFSDATSTTTIAEDSSGNNNDWTANNITVTGEYPFPGNSYRDSSTANQTWDQSTASTTTSAAIGPDRIYWVDLGSSKTFNRITFSVVASGQSSDSSSGFVAYFSTTSSSIGSTICSGGCTITKTGVSSGTTPGTVTVTFAGFASQTGRYIGIGNGSGAFGGTYTYSNFEVSDDKGSDIDSLFDSPTNANADSDTGAGGEVSGNYATWNPLATSTSLTLANGNLQINGAGGGGAYRANSTIAVSSGKWYWETTVTTAGNYSNLGIGQNNLTATDVGVDALSYAWQVETANKVNNSSSSSYGTAATTGDIVMFALDLDNNKFFVGKNGTWFASSDPATGANPMYSIAAGTYTVSARPYINSGSCQFDFNWGQRSWAYTAPTGYQPWTTALFDDPTIADGSTAMDVALYTGNGGDLDVTGLSFNPDLVWGKARSNSLDHFLQDSVRGVSNVLRSNTTGAEAADGCLASFNSDGFSVNPVSLSNQTSTTYVGWAWDGGSSTVSNTDGSITSSVRANASAGFSIVTYTGDGSGTADTPSGDTVGHGLGVAPKLIIGKRRNSANGWQVYHGSLANTQTIELNTTGAALTSAMWGNSTPTSTTIALGNNPQINATGSTYVLYCFAPVEGYSAFGSYTGNGSSDGPFVYTGHRSRWILVKNASVANDWWIYDSARSTYNLATAILTPDSSNSEISSGAFDILSNGFKIRSSGGAWNTNGNTYIFASFASNPFKTARAR